MISDPTVIRSPNFLRGTTSWLEFINCIEICDKKLNILLKLKNVVVQYQYQQYCRLIKPPIIGALYNELVFIMQVLYTLQNILITIYTQIFNNVDLNFITNTNRVWNIWMANNKWKCIKTDITEHFYIILIKIIKIVCCKLFCLLFLSKILHANL